MMPLIESSELRLSLTLSIVSLVELNPPKQKIRFVEELGESLKLQAPLL